MSGAGANALTVSAFDPYSKQPELKHAAVEVTKVDLPYRIVALARREQGAGEALHPLLERSPYATLVPFGRDEPFVELDARDGGAPDAETLAALDAALGFAGGVRGVPLRGRGARGRQADPLRRRPHRRGSARRRARRRRLVARSDDSRRRRAKPASLAAAPVDAPPAAGPARGRVVCNCWDVSEDAIARELAAARSLDEVQSRLKCGTQCGSCVPELRRMAALATGARAVRS